MALCAQSVLAAATLAVQGHADVELPTGQARPLSNFFITVAETGERKTACDEHALSPIRAREKALYRESTEALLVWDNKKAVWDQERKQILNDKKAHPTPQAKSAALTKSRPAPSLPLLPILIAPDPAYEGLAKLLLTGQPSVGVFTSEGGMFIGGHGMTEDAKLRTASGMSALWDGQPIKRVRGTDDISMAQGRRVALHLMAQPDVAAKFLSDAVLADQGLLSRVLVAAPQSTAGTRLWREPSAEGNAAIDRYYAHLLQILQAPLPLEDGTTNELNPRRLTLSPGATTDWKAFADHIEGLIGPGGDMLPIKGLANKLAEHAARISGVLTLVENIDAAEVPPHFMEYGILLAQYYASEALRLFSAGSTDPDLRLAEQLLSWLHNTRSDNNKDIVSLPDIYQLGPHRIRDKKTASKIVDTLEDHGWLTPVEDGAEVNGQRRRDVWRIVRTST